MWLHLIALIFIFNVRDCSSLETRRIVQGKPSTVDKGFMVYFVKSNNSNMKYYDMWLCGGAIVSRTHILTAAACIFDVTHMYAIAGYKKYVRSEHLELDECTRNRKQKVIKTCFPRAYRFNYAQAHRWIGMDIGFAIVEKPYNFSDRTYRMDCTYIPRPLAINFDPHYTEMHAPMIIYGWGHTRSMRLEPDTANYNSPYLQEASTRMVTKKYCKEFFTDDDMKETIETYMICTMGEGNMDSEGNLTDIFNNTNFEFFRGCRRSLVPSVDCGEHDYEDIDGNETEATRNVSDYIDILKSNMGIPDKFLNLNSTRLLLNSTRMGLNTTKIWLNSTRIKPNLNSTKIGLILKARRTGIEHTKRQAICQNDHGGPLVTWVGKQEVIVGVASTSAFDKHHYCVNPSLFTSTFCSMRFIICALYDQLPDEEGDARRVCRKSAEDDDYQLHETEYNWKDGTVKNPPYRNHYEIPRP